jgi:predicted amidophosphoribosyltransferase
MGKDWKSGGASERSAKQQRMRAASRLPTLALGNSVGRATAKMLDLLFPPLCIACREPGASTGFCAQCWSAIQFLDGPLCACCGIPFDVALPEDTLCALCLTRLPAFDKARAILRYDDVSRAPILALKHADRLELVPGFALWLERAGRGLIEASDLIVPVPLHRSRLWRRRYNQAAELARAGAVPPHRPCAGYHGPGAQPFHPQPGLHALGQGPPPQYAGRFQGSGADVRGGACDPAGGRCPDHRSDRRSRQPGPEAGGSGERPGFGAGPRCPGGGDVYIGLFLRRFRP